MSLKCTTCGERTTKDSSHVHHIVPRALGGKDIPGNRVSICTNCHSKIHNHSFTNHKYLVCKGLENARAKGVKLGSPTIERPPPETLLILRQLGMSYKAMSVQLGVAVGTVHKWVQEAPDLLDIASEE